MLDYLYKNHKLAASCFNYAWDDFVRENDFDLTAQDLKTIFWTEIAYNIERYPRLTDEQKEYFDKDYYNVQTAGENTLQALENNEPRQGFDYTFSATTSAYQGTHNETLLANATTREEQMKMVKEAFQKPTICSVVFGEAAAAEDPEANEIEEDSRINIIAQQPMSDLADIGEHPIEIFKEILLTPEDRAAGKKLSEEEVFELLENPNLMINFADGLKQFMYHKLGANLCLEDEFKELEISKQTTIPVEEQTMKPPSQPAKKAAAPRSPFGARATTSTPLIRSSPIKTRNSVDISSIVARRRSLISSSSQSPKSKRRGGELFVSKSDSKIGEKSSEKK